jgi:hypothetical protein
MTPHIVIHLHGLLLYKMSSWACVLENPCLNMPVIGPVRYYDVLHKEFKDGDLINNDK